MNARVFTLVLPSLPPPSAGLFRVSRVIPVVPPLPEDCDQGKQCLFLFRLHDLVYFYFGRLDVIKWLSWFYSYLTTELIVKTAIIKPQNFHCQFWCTPGVHPLPHSVFCLLITLLTLFANNIVHSYLSCLNCFFQYSNKVLTYLHKRMY